MENASKALLMAASVLIGILLMTLMVYIFYFSSNYSNKIEDNLEQKIIYETNMKFQLYDGRIDLTAHDVQTIINMRENYNEGKEETNQIRLDFNTTNFSLENNTNTYTFKITEFKDKIIRKIKITKNP